mmetsp:Transcript_36769/g.108413  ORF Transcript_36769/g.108413 Transcript_36769/m.108413 type:complete len:208 (+) Transcript_36769:353-976(+)
MSALCSCASATPSPPSAACCPCMTHLFATGPSPTAGATARRARPAPGHVPVSLGSFRCSCPRCQAWRRRGGAPFWVRPCRSSTAPSRSCCRFRTLATTSRARPGATRVWGTSSGACLARWARSRFRSRSPRCWWRYSQRSRRRPPALSACARPSPSASPRARFSTPQSACSATWRSAAACLATSSLALTASARRGSSRSPTSRCLCT